MATSSIRKIAPKPRDADTGERILQIAFEMFGRYGYDGVSIDQISKACDLSKGAMYWYYKNKEALFVECVKHMRKLMVAHIYGPMRSATDPKTQMLMFFQGIKSILDDQENLESVSGLLIGIGRIDKPLIREFRTRARHEAEAFMASILENGRAQGQFHFKGTALPKARALFVILEGCLIQARAETAEQTKDALANISVGFYLACGSTPPADLLKQAIEAGSV